MRLDAWLVAQAMVPSRNRAQALIRSGNVFVDGVRADKVSLQIDAQRVELNDADDFVGRAGKKLEAFLQECPVRIEGAACLDVGSSTGGFTQVLLRRGAGSVTAVDVGSGQMHLSLRNDSRIRLYEGTDIRAFACPERFDVLTCDVSFIAFSHIAEAIDRLAGGWIVVLFKPQFEVGRTARRDRRGVVRDDAAVREARKRFEATCGALGWEQRFSVSSKVAGKEGNLEWFYAFMRR